MDVVKQKTGTNQQLIIKIGVAALFIVVMLILLFTRESAYAVNESQVVTASVKQGEFSVAITAPGTLVPQKINLLSAGVDGKVEEILAYPGSYLKKGDIILKMSNPKLEQSLLDLQGELEALQASVDATRAANVTETLAAEAQIVVIHNRYQMAKLESDAFDNLERRGMQSSSAIEVQRAKLLVEQLEERYNIESKKIVQLRVSLNARLKEKEAMATRLIKIVKKTESDIAMLQVISPLDGTLQTLSVELGQKVAVDENIARIAQNHLLKAELKVSEYEASRIVIGQSATIDTRLSQMEGEVVRVDPSVSNGTVRVDVRLNGELSKEARPDLSINGRIVVGFEPNQLYVKRPVFSVPNKTIPVYKFRPDSDMAEKVDVTFGDASSTDITVVNGLKAGDRIIISEYSTFAGHDKVVVRSN